LTSLEELLQHFRNAHIDDLSVFASVALVIDSRQAKRAALLKPVAFQAVQPRPYLNDDQLQTIYVELARPALHCAAAIIPSFFLADLAQVNS
jgi:hypothetical protein